ncbi:MAG TPA: DNA mismatch repair protein MutS, partial [Caldilineaceae bacterium]|nr:DNA mismatch repair protein MutS [Caldilineaceae bacterium]
MTTPMRQQYLELKAQHPQCILFFRLGDFYETFDEDAKIVAKVCDVVLTSKPIGENVRVPLAGVPYHAVDSYLARLVEAGYKVAVADQMTEPGRGLIEREVTRVVTKGTIVDLGMLDAKRNNYLMAVVFDARGVAGVAYCDITTGEFAATQIAGGREAVEQRVGEELSRLQPSELIHVDWDPDDSALQLVLATFNPLLSSVEPWQTELTTATNLLKGQLQVTSLDGFGLAGKPSAVRAAAAILAYLQAMQPGSLAQMTQIRTYELGHFMTLDESTRRNLELTATMRGGEVKGSLLDVLDQTLTPMGGRLLRRWLNQPLVDVWAINQRLDTVALLDEKTALRLELREHLRGMGDLERWTNRAVQGIAIPRDLDGMRQALRRVGALNNILNGEPEPTGWVWEETPTPDDAGDAGVLSSRPACDDLLALLAAALADEPPATLATPGFIRPGYSTELDELLARSRHAKEWIANLEQTERERLDIKSLKVGYNKVFGYYIEITNPHAHKTPADYIRKQTLTNAERYITPELKEYETLVLNDDDRRLESEQQMFRELCAQRAGAASRLLAMATALAELDVYAALAEVALSTRYVRPLVSDSPCLQITAGRHPVVELTLTDEPFVPNDTHLTPDAAIHLITGPNMAGKSTLLRQVALITLMA